MKKEIFDTKVTSLGKGLFGCRIIDINSGDWIIQSVVKKSNIQLAIREMLRTLDKLGYDSPMANASRMRKSTISDREIQSIKFTFSTKKG
jgi:hypothetical protein